MPKLVIKLLHTGLLVVVFFQILLAGLGLYRLEHAQTKVLGTMTSAK